MSLTAKPAIESKSENRLILNNKTAAIILRARMVLLKPPQV
jgi:hypothetical protein